MAKKDERRQQLQDVAEDWRMVVDAAGARAGIALIYRKIKGEQDRHLETVAIGHVKEDPQGYLRGRWGGGEFRVLLKDTDGTYIKESTVHFSLEGPPILVGDDEKAEAKLEAEIKRRVELALAGGSKNDEIVVELIRQQGANSRSGADPMEIVTAMMTALATAAAPVIAALVEKKKEPAPSMKDSIETLAAMLQLAQNMGGNDGGIGALASAFGGPISKLVDAHVERESSPSALSIPAPTEPAPPAWFGLFQPMVPQLLTWAGRNADAVLRAEFVLDELADDQLGTVHAFLSADSFLPEFFAYVSGAGDHRDWFGTFFQTMLQGIEVAPAPVPTVAAELGEAPTERLEATEAPTERLETTVGDA